MGSNPIGGLLSFNTSNTCCSNRQLLCWHSHASKWPNTKLSVKFQSGEAGHRSQCLSHAERALYHLSYIPIDKMKHKLFNNCFIWQASVNTVKNLLLLSYCNCFRHKSFIVRTYEIQNKIYIEYFWGLPWSSRFKSISFLVHTSEVIYKHNHAHVV